LRAHTADFNPHPDPLPSRERVYDPSPSPSPTGRGDTGPFDKLRASGERESGSLGYARDKETGFFATLRMTRRHERTRGRIESPG